MVTIPRIGIPTDVPMRAQPTPELNLPGGEDWRMAGQAFRLAGQVVGAVDAKLLERDRTAAKEHETGYRQELGHLSDPDEGFFSLRGDHAIKAADATKKRVQDARLKGREGLSGRAARMYDDITLAREAETLEGIDRWTEQQQRFKDDQVSEARADQGLVEFKANMQSEDPEIQTRGRASLAQSRLEITEARRRQGVPDEVIKNDLRKLDSAAYAGAVLAALDKNPNRAAGILEEGRNIIEPPLFGELQGKVENGVLQHQALSLAAGQDVAGSGYDLSGVAAGAEQTLARVFREAELPEVVVGALIGNAVRESSLNPGAYHAGDQKDGSASVGLFQWDPNRLAAGKAWAATNKLHWNNLETQARFAVQELKTTEPAAYKRMMAARTAEEANAAVLDFLRPQGWRRGGDPTKVHSYNERLAETRRVLGGSKGGLEALPADVMTIDAADAHARKLAVGDPKKFGVYRDVFHVEVTRRRAAQEQRERDARDDLFEFYKNNPNVRSWQQVPPSIRGRLSNEDAVAQREYWAQKVGGGVKTDAGTYLGLMDLAGKDSRAFMDTDLRRFVNKLDEPDLQQVATLQTVMRREGAQGQRNVAMTLERIDRASDIVMPPELQKRTKDRQAFKAEYLRVAQDMSARGDVNDDQLLHLGRQVLQTRFRKSAWFGLTTETSREAAWHADIEDVPVKDRHQIEADWMKRHRGQRPTADQILNTWRDMQYYGVTR